MFFIFIAKFMNYIEYKVEACDEQHAEILIAELADVGFESFSEFDPTTKTIDCYILKSDERVDEVAEILGNTKFIRTEIEQRNWNAEWESNFEPIEVDNRCYIRATFHEPRSVEHEIVITPKMSFGTGHHPTTHLVVEFMLDERFDGMQVLDMGSGTGILAILAAQRGALVVDAIDIDEWAYVNCVENIQLNGVQSVICPILGDASAVDKQFDVVLANINRNILLRDMPIYEAHLRVGGLLIVSGILELDIDVIEQRAVELGLRVEHVKTRLGWAAIKFLK